MIDTHCHLDVDAFDDDRDAMLARAAAAGVVGMLVPAIRPRTWAAVVELGRAHAAAGVRIALGIHPQIVPALDADEVPADLAGAIAAAVEASGAVAVGECGLDGATGELARQEAILRAHVRAARAVKRPLVIHILRAHDLAPRVLREERVHEVGGVLHSYSGGAELVPIYADLGLEFSFAGPITYPNARRPIEAGARGAGGCAARRDRRARSGSGRASRRPQRAGVRRRDRRRGAGGGAWRDDRRGHGSDDGGIAAAVSHVVILRLTARADRE